jgi:hypothetical protein
VVTGPAPSVFGEEMPCLLEAPLEMNSAWGQVPALLPTPGEVPRQACHGMSCGLSKYVHVLTTGSWNCDFIWK